MSWSILAALPNPTRQAAATTGSEGMRMIQTSSLCARVSLKCNESDRIRENLDGIGPGVTRRDHPRVKAWNEGGMACLGTVTHGDGPVVIGTCHARVLDRRQVGGPRL